MKLTGIYDFAGIYLYLQLDRFGDKHWYCSHKAYRQYNRFRTEFYGLNKYTSAFVQKRLTFNSLNAKIYLHLRGNSSELRR